MSVEKDVDVRTIRERLLEIANEIHEVEGKVKATLVMDETYRSVTAVIGNQVLCINLMN